MSPIRFLSAAALAVSLATPLAASAQQAPPPAPPAPPAGTAPAPGHRPHAHFMHALRTLTLSDSQKQSIKTAFTQMRSADQNADPQTRKSNVEQFRSTVNGILTPDQRAQLQAELRKERADAMNAPASGAAAPHA